MLTISFLTQTLILLPLISGGLVGVFGKLFGKYFSQIFTSLSVIASLIISIILFKFFIFNAANNININFYEWAHFPGIPIHIGLLIDHLSIMMAVIVCFISSVVHIYSMGYMSQDEGVIRFFSYIALFTFAMLVLIFANNFALLFFGWEGVGLMSYLLIGFWFERDTANVASLKAFYLNRIADFGFILGIAGILNYYHTLDFYQIFNLTPNLLSTSVTLIPHHPWQILTVITALIFIGAMGKSAQPPLHVWLPESMEGPTPISALIHAATMVTAGIYLMARLSPLYQYAPATLNFILIIGSSAALFLGLLAIVQNDIKRIVAYSTLSQLGYMMAAAGASAYSASLFHLFTHACFKALLFLGAGSVILALHHEQDIRKMGGLYKKMPLTYLTFIIGSIALIALPFTSGFYSKDSIIAAVHYSHSFASYYAYFCLLAGTFVTAFYTFRCLFLVFHGNPKHMDSATENSMIITVPLIILAVPSLILGYFLIQNLLIDTPSWFGNSLFVFPNQDSELILRNEFHSAFNMALSAFLQAPFLLSISGILLASVSYLFCPSWPKFFSQKFRFLYLILIHKYGFDAFNHLIFVRGTLKISKFFGQKIDDQLLDNYTVNGTGKLVRFLARCSQKLQSGFLNQYLLIMIIGLLLLLVWQVK